MEIIGFAGRARAGKTSLANYLSGKGYEIYTIATSIKNLACSLLSIEKEELITLKDSGKEVNLTPTKDWFSLISKETKIDEKLIEDAFKPYKTIKTIRELLQVIGTDVIRLYNPSWHINTMIKSIKHDKVVVDDVRFPNERKIIEDLGGVVYFIVRPNFNDISNHTSETSLCWRSFSDHNIIENVGTREQLEKYFGYLRGLEKYNEWMESFIVHSSKLRNKNDIISEINNPLIVEDLKMLL